MNGSERMIGTDKTPIETRERERVTEGRATLIDSDRKFSADKKRIDREGTQ